MTSHTFTPKDDYIELNKLLKVLSLIDSGGEAKQLISDWKILVNNEIELRIRKKLVKGDIIVYGEHTITIE